MAWASGADLASLHAPEFDPAAQPASRRTPSHSPPTALSGLEEHQRDEKLGCGSHGRYTPIGSSEDASYPPRTASSEGGARSERIMSGRDLSSHSRVDDPRVRDLVLLPRLRDHAVVLGLRRERREPLHLLQRCARSRGRGLRVDTSFSLSSPSSEAAPRGVAAPQFAVVAHVQRGLRARSLPHARSSADPPAVESALSGVSVGKITTAPAAAELVKR
eukprot:CAMPEP_0179851706 /NCGR_PEP_ID=MMETSP0982-20121206/8400_1 /TAXON_ID=483367 /ORGANISM="non described non described, Strain CCMP 2436" /LENGTH=217 /DNA_ID=CAMNT_0021737257 /DNA_START=160 /DNA_END=812 /DNA_ORIENTATION=-